MNATLLYMQNRLQLFTRKKTKNKGIDFEPHNVFNHCFGEPMPRNEKKFF